jgi:O-antigen/teichoic acid export membrane protein
MKILHTLKQSNFLRHNAVFFFGSVAVGALNYAYYPILGRLMSPAEFGEIQVLVSLFLQFTIFLNVLGMITINITANYDSTAKAHRMIYELEKLAVFIAMAILVFTIIAGGFLAQALQFDSSAPFIALALALVVSIPLTFRSAYARGQKKFGVASTSQLIGAGVKILFSAALVVAGLGVTGAIFGIVGAQLAAFIYAAWWATKLGLLRPKISQYGKLPVLKSILPELKYSIFVFVGLLTITLMMSIDVILVKYYFDAETAGQYAGIATVARIIFFLAVPIAQVLMPMVKIKQSARQNGQLLAKSLVLTVLVCGSALVICLLFPEVILRTLMGGQYGELASLLPILSLVVFIISLVNLVVMYYLALRHKMIVLVGIIGFGVVVGLVLADHATVSSIVYNILLGSILTLVAAGLYVLTTIRRGSPNAHKDDLDHRPNL